MLAFFPAEVLYSFVTAMPSFEIWGGGNCRVKRVETGGFLQATGFQLTVVKVLGRPWLLSLLLSINHLLLPDVRMKLFVVTKLKVIIVE